MKIEFKDRFVRTVSNSFFDIKEKEFYSYYKYSVKSWIKALNEEDV